MDAKIEVMVNSIAAACPVGTSVAFMTSAGTADRVLGTYPDSAETPTSPTAKNLHALSA